MIASSKTAATLLLAVGTGRGFTVTQPPMPFKWPVVGTLPDFLTRGGVDKLREIYEDMYSEYGDIYGMSIMGEDELIICDPYVFDTVLRKEGKFPIGGAESATTFVDYYKETNNTMGMKSMSRGPSWQEWRQPLVPDMYVGWDKYLPAIADAASKISKVAGYEVTETSNIAFVDFISRSAFDMFASMMYGTSPQTTNSEVADPTDIEFVGASQTAFDLTGEILTNPFEKTFGSDTYKSFKVNMDKTFDIGYKKAVSYAEDVQQKQVAEEGEGEGSKCPVTAIKNNVPFVERLMNRGQMPLEDITSISGPMLMAGVDTTAYVLSWLFLNLASNPVAQTKLAEELNAVLKGADITTVEQIDSLPYLKAVIRESHRLTPPTTVSAKKLEQDIDVVVGDKAYRVLANQRISLNVRAFPMDPRFVDNPNMYQPDRFLPHAIEARKGTPSEVIDHPSFADPFGRGKRRCLGSNVAMAEITILTARLIQDYDISLVDPNDATKWKPKQKLMLKADPYPAMKLIPRHAVTAASKNKNYFMEEA